MIRSKAHHLGNVRAVVSANSSGVAETVSHTDYYPHGGTLPGRTYQSSLNFPYGYQGQEKDAATGLTNFELRQYDPRIGRWYNPDPYMQHHSPNLAMSNNPISFTDPDGGWDGDGGYDDAMPGVIDRNKNDFAAQSFAASGKVFDWMNASPADREMMQGFYGTDYNSQAKDRILDNAALGGYEAKDGSVYNLDAAGNLSRSVTESILIAGVASWSTKFSDVTTTTIVGNVNSRNLLLASSNNFNKRSVFGTANTYTGTPTNSNKIGIDLRLHGWQHAIGPISYLLTSPTPKRFVAQDSSQTSALFSEALSKAFPQKIQIGTTRRLYTHTVNGSARYAATWGRFIGRWGTRVLGPVGVFLTAVDFTTFLYDHKAEIKEGMNARDNYIQQGLMPLR